MADICFAAFGRREIEFEENEIRGLVAFRRKYSPQHVFKGARITKSLSISIQIAVLIETLTASVLRSHGSFATFLHPKTAAAIATSGMVKFAWKGETDEKFEWCLETQMVCLLRRSRGPTMILDDSGNLAALVHEKYPHLILGFRGVTEETTLGVLRLYKLLKQNTLKIPTISIKLDNLHGCGESLIDAIKCATDVMIPRKVALVVGFGNVGKDSVHLLGAWTLVSS
ncbi:hypothetical protein BGZ74_008413 [Mortierella antarctica]|nr:hypothetical protein BGZ74_008413 [Mortierella antarctica]